MSAVQPAGVGSGLQLPVQRQSALLSRRGCVVADMQPPPRILGVFPKGTSAEAEIGVTDTGNGQMQVITLNSWCLGGN